MPVLEVRDLSVTYPSRAGAVPAVRGVDRTLDAGEILGLAGESGCGKSTMAAAVLRLLPPGTKTSGSVLLEGEDVLTMRPGRLRAVRWTEAAIVFQGAMHALNPVRRVGDRQAATRVGQLLEQVGLPARGASSYPHELSGGQRQRVMIAGALALEPSVLVADEPVSSLDASVRGEILALLLGLVRDLGLSVLVVTHDLGLAWNIADRLAVMYLGRIVEQGPTEAVLAAPRHPYTRALLSVVPEVHHLEEQILTGEPPDPTRVPGGCRFHPAARPWPRARPPRRASRTAAAPSPCRPAQPGRGSRCLLPD
jgi:peptide/nickel transport system ATP-binding protein